jgi:hypothetical protein
MMDEATPLFPEGLTAKLHLADYAAVTPDGKLTMVGAGWTTIPPGVPFAVAGFIDVPWDQANTNHKVTMRLVDADGELVTVQLPDGSEVPAGEEFTFQVGRPPNVTPRAQPVPVAMFHSPLPLTPGQDYAWRTSINGNEHEDWRLPFSVAPAPQSNVA